MDCCDACIYPYPIGDSSLRRMVLEMREMGFDGVVTIGDQTIGNAGGMTILKGGIADAETARDAYRQTRKLSERCDLVMVQARDTSFNREVVTFPGIRILCGLYRLNRGGFDHVVARRASERGVAVDLSFRPLIMYRGVGRQRVLERYLEIIRLHRKFGFPLTISSSARSVLELRSPRELQHLGALIGMEKEEVKSALKTVESLINGRGPVEVVQ
ncbi:MAG: RNase P subunit p30 family protein [Methanoculleaceae archaeon]